MLIEEIEISGYRSIDDLSLKLGKVTVLVGANGTGKSNIYQAIQLIAACATGQIARRIAEEGGIESILWAGRWHKSDKPRVFLSVKFDELTYELEFGRVPISDRINDLGCFANDPDIKNESIDFWNGKKKVSLLARKRGSIKARNMDGRNVEFPANITGSESVLSELREPQRFPEVSMLRAEFSSWRFYHDFRTDIDSPIREPQLATMTHVLSHDGEDLAAVLATIRAVGNRRRFEDAVERAFPGSALSVSNQANTLTMTMAVPGVFRDLSSREFSDGTLQYLCLLAALLSSRPAPFVVLNEPETSVHPDLAEPLAELIVTASSESQILLTTHSRDLARHLSKKSDVSVIELEKVDGATCVKGTRKPRRQSESDDDYYYDNGANDEGGAS